MDQNEKWIVPFCPIDCNHLNYLNVTQIVKQVASPGTPPPRRVQILSFSWGFRQKICKILG